MTAFLIRPRRLEQPDTRLLANAGSCEAVASVSLPQNRLSIIINTAANDGYLKEGSIRGGRRVVKTETPRRVCVEQAAEGMLPRSQAAAGSGLRRISVEISSLLKRQIASTKTGRCASR